MEDSKINTNVDVKWVLVKNHKAVHNNGKSIKQWHPCDSNDKIPLLIWQTSEQEPRISFPHGASLLVMHDKYRIISRMTNEGTGPNCAKDYPPRKISLSHT